MQGSPGLPGRSKVNGHNGLPGREGPDGAEGKKGVTGTPGPRGIKGEMEQVEKTLITETGNSAPGKSTTTVILD